MQHYLKIENPRGFTDTIFTNVTSTMNSTGNLLHELIRNRKEERTNEV